MKPFLRSILFGSSALCALALALAPDVLAQPGESPLLPGEAGLFFDAEGTQRVASIPLFGTFDVYLVARVPPGGLSAYDLVAVVFPANTLVATASPTLPSGSAFELQLIADACSFAVGIDPNTCPAIEGEVVALVRYPLVRMGGDGHVCLEEFQCPTIAGSVAVEVRYRSCADPDEDRPLDSGRLACLSLDGTVATTTSSWTTTKAWFGSNPRR